MSAIEKDREIAAKATRGEWAHWNTGDKDYGWQVGIVSRPSDGKRLAGDIEDTDEWMSADWGMDELVTEHWDGRNPYDPAHIVRLHNRFEAYSALVDEVREAVKRGAWGMGLVRALVALDAEQEERP